MIIQSYGLVHLRTGLASKIGMVYASVGSGLVLVLVLVLLAF